MHRIAETTRARVIFGLLLIGLLACPAAADTEPAVPDPHDAATPEPEPGNGWLPDSPVFLNTNGHAGRFARDTWTVQAYGSVAIGDSAGALYVGHVGVGYHLMDNLSINAEAVGGYIDDIRNGDESNAGIFGLDLLARWHMAQGDGWTVFLDAGAGIAQSSERFPADGTRFNFTPQAGMGFTLDVADDVVLLVGARWQHISNADRHGSDRNPGLDTALTYLGVMFTF